MSSLSPAKLSSVTLTGGLLHERQRTILKHSIPQQYHQLQITGRIAALQLNWKPGMPNKPHEFWDSDIAKWIESAAFSLYVQPNPALESQVDEVVEMMAKVQESSGYLNSFFQSVMPDRKFTNLRDQHELYCAGHLIEAAVAYYEVSGKRQILDVLSKYADHIGKVFGPNAGQKHGYDGHEEIELALVKLAQVTGQKKYLELATYFVTQRGVRPGEDGAGHFFQEEAKARGETPKPLDARSYEYFQAHAPVEKQATAEGHSVRAMYLFAGVADVAGLTKNRKLLAAARKVFDNVVQRRMYVTGGIGSSRHGERFTYDFDLPNESAYAETCASIALIFFAQRMLNLDRDGKYADAMETALYNTCLAGISLEGTQYFYANYLATDVKWHEFEAGYPARRQDWFGCACCPPNLARLIASIGGYAYSVGKKEVAVNLYTDSRITLDFGGPPVQLRQATGYPFDGKVKLFVDTATPVSFTMSLRIPAWADKPTLKVNGKSVKVKGLKGYVAIARTWDDGDSVELELPMPPRRVYADPRVRNTAGMVALARGPLVYCLESKDNGPSLGAVSLPSSAKINIGKPNKSLGNVATLQATGHRDLPVAGQPLYAGMKPKRKAVALTAIPYYTWANRGDHEMMVWIRES